MMRVRARNPLHYNEQKRDHTADTLEPANRSATYKNKRQHECPRQISHIQGFREKSGEKSGEWGRVVDRDVRTHVSDVGQAEQVADERQLT